MSTILISPTVTVDLVLKRNDLVNAPFTVLDDASNPVNFSGYTSAKMTVKNNELTTEIISFTYTGSTYSGITYSIDISKRSTGVFTLITNSLAIIAGEYLYDFEVSTGVKKQTIMQGKFIVVDDITR